MTFKGQLWKHTGKSLVILHIRQATTSNTNVSHTRDDLGVQIVDIVTSWRVTSMLMSMKTALTFMIQIGDGCMVMMKCYLRTSKQPFFFLYYCFFFVIFAFAVIFV